MVGLEYGFVGGGSEGAVIVREVSLDLVEVLKMIKYVVFENGVEFMLKTRQKCRLLQ